MTTHQLLHQSLIPARPTHAPDGSPYNYRTRINPSSRQYEVMKTEHRLSQLLLYRWSVGMDYMNFVPLEDLHAFLFFYHPNISKVPMGRTLRQAIIYNHSKLKGKTVEEGKARQCLFLRHREELQYGLEWMLSYWIWRIQYKWVDVKDDPAKFNLEIFNEIATLDDDEFDDLYIQPTVKTDFIGFERQEVEPPWDKYGFYPEEEKRPDRPTDRPKLRSLG